MKKKIKFLTLGILTLGIFSCSQKNNLEVEIPEIGNDTIYVENYKISNFGEDPILDTLYSKNGKFIYNLKINEPILSLITPKKAQYVRLNKSFYRPFEKSILLILKPDDKISVKGNLDKTNLKYQAKGSLINESYSNFRNEYSNALIEKSAIELKIDSLMSKNGDRNEINRLFKKRKEKAVKASNIQLNYIKNNLNKDISAFYLTRQPLDTLGKYFNQLTKIVKEGVFKDLLKSQFNTFEKYKKVKEAELSIKIGKEAPKFSLKNINGEKIRIDYSSNKLTILDFWGSWCAPCIAGFPKMKAYYEKYNNQINFIGIACNDKEDKWKNAVKKYDLKWENLINNDDLEKDVSVIFAVMGYPTKIVINSKGIIEGIFEGEGNDFYEKIDELRKN